LRVNQFSRLTPADEKPNESPANPAISTAASTTVSTNPAVPGFAFHTTYADLARVVELWPVLPPAIRAAILTLANTTAPSPPPGVSAGTDDRDRLPPGYERPDPR
jgi:hypothetical protein